VTSLFRIIKENNIRRVIALFAVKSEGQERIVLSRWRGWRIVCKLKYKLRKFAFAAYVPH